MIEINQSAAVAGIVFEYPPVNAISVGGGLVDALAAAIARVQAQAEVKAIVVSAKGKIFSGGADIKDFELPAAALDRLRTLTADLIEGSVKPVVMAIHGMALGGGLELALSAHYRICAKGTRLGLPEVTLGLLPGAGGTQRLPRLVGVERALQMMLSGKPIDAAEALAIGLVDRVAIVDLQTEAMNFAESLIGSEPRRARDLGVSGDAAPALRAARDGVAKLRTSSPAPGYIIDCVAAACTQPFETGLALEARLFDELRRSESSLGLRHVFFGQREVARIPNQGAAPAAPPVRSVAVVGAGLMGTGISLALLNAGLPVTLVEVRPEALAKAVASVRTSLERDVAKGRVTAAAAAARLQALAPAAELEAAGEADLIIEAVYESLDAKRDVFARLDRLAKPAAVLASNTSTLDVDAIAAFTQRPEQVLGLHFFSPANVMRLVEVVRGVATSPAVLAAAMAFTRAIGKVGVVAGVCDGFIGNRMFEEYLRQAYLLLEEGATTQQVDGALERWGMAMGPLRVMDLAGQDIGWSIRKRRAIEQPERPYSRIPDMICEMGRFGQKTGAGFYRYDDGRTATADPQIDAMIDAYSQSLGIARRVPSDAEIVERCIFALVNEGAKILDEGIAYRAVDIDIVTVFGYGFPAERGGPLFHAERLGLAHVLERVQAYAAGRAGWAWTPAPLLVRRANAGTGWQPA